MDRRGDVETTNNNKNNDNKNTMMPSATLVLLVYPTDFDARL